jgi:hypothetical protein
MLRSISFAAACCHLLCFLQAVQHVQANPDVVHTVLSRFIRSVSSALLLPVVCCVSCRLCSTCKPTQM